jgi:cell division septal protein FtsQ
VNRRPWARPQSRRRQRKVRFPTRARLAKWWEEIRAECSWIKIPAVRPRALLAGGSACFVIAVLLLAARGKVVALLENSRLTVKSIAVEGNRHAEAEEILALTGLQKGASWVFLDAGTIRRRARVHPWVEDVVVERPWIGKVRLKIREHVPIALLDWGGVKRGIAEDMKILPPSPADSSDLPRIRGVFHKTKRGLDLGALERALSYVHAIRRERGVASLPVVLTMNPSGRDEIQIESIGIDVVLEEPLPPEIAVRNVAAFLETLDSPGECRGTLHVFSKTAAVWAAKV